MKDSLERQFERKLEKLSKKPKRTANRIDNENSYIKEIDLQV